jgi:hypothetical protein
VVELKLKVVMKHRSLSLEREVEGEAEKRTEGTSE